MFLRKLARNNFNVFTLIKRNLSPKSVIQKFTFIGVNIIKSKKFSIPSTLAFIIFAQAAAVKNKLKMSEENIEHVLQNADQLFDENHYQEVYDLLLKYPDQSLAEIKWREARALFSISKAVKDKNERNKMIRDSYELIKVALETDDKNFAIHKWMAIILDAYAELDGMKARITELETVKKHMKLAVEINPHDPTSWYLLGAFEFGLAELPWIQRKIVSTIFATPPTGTYEQALDYFQHAEGLKEGFYSTNWLMMGKCFMALKKNEEAKKFIEKAANCPVLNEDDKKCKEEASQIFKKL